MTERINIDGRSWERDGPDLTRSATCDGALSTGSMHGLHLVVVKQKIDMTSKYTGYVPGKFGPTHETRYRAYVHLGQALVYRGEEHPTRDLAIVEGDFFLKTLRAAADKILSKDP